jgi:hypothetical protein
MARLDNAIIPNRAARGMILAPLVYLAFGADVAKADSLRRSEDAADITAR